MTVLRETAPVGTLPAFPPGFLWGAATASYQIEGAVGEDGRGPSIWDTFSHTPGAVLNGDTGDVACDHYHRWREDVALLRDLGVGAYRFSVAWPRVQPTGSGAVNQAGLDFYSQLVDGLLEAGIRPVVTLYHWDLPQALEDGGGWRVRQTAELFAQYATIVHGALGDRVPMWITFNEPFVSSFIGYGEGRHAPGAREGLGALAAAHHLLVGHGLALQAMRAQRRSDEQFGITLNLNDHRLAAAGDEAANRAAMVRAETRTNRTFTDPLLAKRYPAAEAQTWPGLTDRPFRLDGDLNLIAQPLDFLGVNTYFPEYVADAPFEQADPAERAAVDVGFRQSPPEGLRTVMGWPIDPTIMAGLLHWLRTEYPGLPPVYVTENGAAFPDQVDAAGEVQDDQRIAYLDGHLRSLHEAIEQGADVRGYFCWSLMDNFEWAMGYLPRFGLVHVDYATQKRTPKASYHWYQREINR
jgi:beta-glucosidase